MDYNERELFTYRIRSGVYRVSLDNCTVKIYTPTVEDQIESCEIYEKSYRDSINDDILTEEEMTSWLIEIDHWSHEEDLDIKNYEKEIENLKINVFKYHNNVKLRESARVLLRNVEKGLSELEEKKYIYSGNTCEGIATFDKNLFLLERCSYIGGERVNFDEVSSHKLLSKYHALLFRESTLREIARTEPWRSIWLFKDVGSKLFFNKEDRELSMDQKNLLVWSRMYDNIHESMECPSDKIIEDDDALDGWFIEQRRKREKEKDIERVEEAIKNPKIANSQEVIVFADNKTDANAIESMNSINAKMIKKERQAVLKNQTGSAVDSDFKDQKLRMSNQSHSQFKNKFRR